MTISNISKHSQYIVAFLDHISFNGADWKLRPANLSKGTLIFPSCQIVHCGIREIVRKVHVPVGKVLFGVIRAKHHAFEARCWSRYSSNRGPSSGSPSRGADGPSLL